jgi:hypothetical protein
MVRAFVKEDLAMLIRNKLNVSDPNELASLLSSLSTSFKCIEETNQKL